MNQKNKTPIKNSERSTLKEQQGAGEKEKGKGSTHNDNVTNNIDKNSSGTRKVLRNHVPRTMLDKQCDKIYFDFSGQAQINVQHYQIKG